MKILCQLILVCLGAVFAAPPQFRGWRFEAAPSSSEEGVLLLYPVNVDMEPHRILFPYFIPSPVRPVEGRSAIMTLQPGADSGVRGTIQFYQASASSAVSVTGTISGLSPGKHGFHVHQGEGRQALGNQCKDAKGHFNPLNRPHGAPGNPEDSRHVGDLGNIVADANGVAYVNIQDKVISLYEGTQGIINRSIVVHAGEDDLGRGGDEGSTKTGNAGGRLACGVIVPA